MALAKKHSLTPGRACNTLGKGSGEEFRAVSARPQVAGGSALNIQSTSLVLCSAMNRSPVRHRCDIVIFSSCEHCFGSTLGLCNACLPLYFPAFFFFPSDFLKRVFIKIPVSCSDLGLSARDMAIINSKRCKIWERDIPVLPTCSDQCVLGHNVLGSKVIPVLVTGRCLGWYLRCSCFYRPCLGK